MLQPPEAGRGLTIASRPRCWRRTGVDLTALEMLRDVEQATYAVVEAATTSGLPVWAGLSCKRRADGTIVLWDGDDTLAEALEKMPLSNVAMICVMHTLVEDTPAALGEVAGGWGGPVGAYPHAGRFVDAQLAVYR
jgi:S-methylmethionine-dependent homocysteine/selenocysteine methylase